MTNTIIFLRIAAAVPGLGVLGFLFFEMCRKLSIRCYGRLKYNKQYRGVMHGRSIEEKLRENNIEKVMPFLMDQSALYKKYDLLSKEDND